MGVSHSMNTIRLHLFTWTQSVGEGGGLAVRPVCPTHPDSPIDIQNTIDGNNLSVSCSAGGQVHAVNMCSKGDFDAEKREAENILRRG